MDNNAEQPAADLRALDALFGAALYRADCPISDRLLEHVAGLLDPSEARAVEAHVAICAHCRSELGLIGAPLVVGPAARIAAGLTAARTLIHAVLQGSVAELALRGSDENALRYDAGAYHVVVAFVPPTALPGPGQIEGQLIGGAAAGLAELFQGDTLVQASELDALGFFAFDDVAPGEYTIRLAHDVDLIVIDRVQLH